MKQKPNKILKIINKRIMYRTFIKIYYLIFYIRLILYNCNNSFNSRLKKINIYSSNVMINKSKLIK